MPAICMCPFFFMTVFIIPSNRKNRLGEAILFGLLVLSSMQLVPTPRCNAEKWRNARTQPERSTGSALGPVKPWERWGALITELCLAELLHCFLKDQGKTQISCRDFWLIAVRAENNLGTSNEWNESDRPPCSCCMTPSTMWYNFLQTLQQLPLMHFLKCPACSP